MPFINTTNHEHLRRLFQKVIDTKEKRRDIPSGDGSADTLREDMDQLHQIVEEYKVNLYKMEDLTRRYNALFRRLRVGMRKEQLKLQSGENHKQS